MSDRRVAVSRRLSAAARDLAIARGVAGFRVEEVTAAAGVSRRTFFNHFASKEHAVLGIAAWVPADVGEADFLDPQRGTGRLLPDLGELMMRRMEAYIGSAGDFDALRRVLRREPALHRLLTELSGARLEDDARLVERRQRLEPGAPAARLAVDVAVLLLQRVLEQRLSTTPQESFRETFDRELALLGAVLVAPPVPGTP